MSSQLRHSARLSRAPAPSTSQKRKAQRAHSTQKVAKSVKLEANRSDKLKGTVFCITGKLSVKRSEFEAFIVANGGRTASTVTRSVTHLVAALVTSSKAIKAQEQGCKIVTEEWVRAQVSSNSASSKTGKISPEASGTSENCGSDKLKGKVFFVVDTKEDTELLSSERSAIEAFIVANGGKTESSFTRSVTHFLSALDAEISYEYSCLAEERECEFVDELWLRSQVDEHASEDQLRQMIEEGFKMKNEIKWNEIRKRYGLSCFTWKLGPPCDDASELDFMADRVGGLNSFATYLDKAEDWPCGKEFYFVCQVDLSKIPTKMKRMVGESGLLQIFHTTDGDNWTGESFVRLIPRKEFSKLAPCSGLPGTKEELEPNSYCQDPREHAPKAFPIVEWNEHVDVPCQGDELHEDFDEELRVESVDLASFYDEHVHLKVNKFGGYGSYTQGGGGSPERCTHCGKNHGCQNQFQMVQYPTKGHFDEQVFFNLPFGDNGTIQFTWCPEKIEETVVLDGACC